MIRSLLPLLMAIAWFCPQAPAGDLATLATQAAESFTPITKETLASSRRDLLDRSAKLGAVINRQPDGGEAWRRYLKWGAVEALADVDAKPDLATLQSTLSRLNSGAEGLELPAFRQAADSLQRHLDLATVGGSKNQAAAFRQVVEAVPALLANDEPPANEWLGYLLERRLALLANLGQADPLLAEARGRFSKPNLLLSVSEPMLDRLIQRPVDSRSPIRDRILGARVVGTGNTRGWLSVDLRPSADAARLDFSLHGSIHSETTSYKGPVAVRSTANTPISAVKTVRLTPEAFYLEPASASATMRSRTRSIRKVGGGLGAGLIEKLAKKQVAQDRPKADRIASGRAAGRVATSLNQQIEEAVRGLRRRYDKAWTKPLARYGAEPERFSLSTTDATLEARLLQADQGQLGATSEPPPSPPGDVVACLHVSAVQNLATAILSGASLYQTAADQPVKLSAKLPEWASRLRSEPKPSEDAASGDFKPWKLTLRRVRPLSVRIEEGVATLIVHAAQIQSAGDQFRGWDLIVKYAPRLVDGQWVLERRGEVDARRTKPHSRTGWAIRTRDRPVYSNLIKTLRKTTSLPATVELAPVDLSQRDLRGLKSLAVQSIELADGWLAISLQAL